MKIDYRIFADDAMPTDCRGRQDVWSDALGGHLRTQ